jgi:hypothetical protein
LPKATTDDGIKIDFNPLLRNASAGISGTAEPFSNVATEMADTETVSEKITNGSDEGPQTRPLRPEAPIEVQFRISPLSTSFRRLKSLETPFATAAISSQIG